MVYSESTRLLIERGAVAAVDFESYLRFVLNIRVEPHQRGWLDACQEIGDNPNGQKIVIIAPPGSGKSVFVAVGFTSWIIGKYPDEHFGLISFADKPAQERATAVRNTIEHEQPYRLTFPYIEPDYSSWAKGSFRVKRKNTSDPHPTLRAAGALAAVVSYRLSGLVIDDPHDPKNSGNPRNREKVYNNYVEAISTRLIPKAWQLVITTRWADDDFAGRLLRLRHRGAPVWQSVHVPALDRYGKTYWPSRIPQEELDRIKYTMPVTFAIQYMGDTAGGETQIIPEIASYGDYEEDERGCPTLEFVKKQDLVMGMGWDSVPGNMPITLRINGYPIIVSFDELWNMLSGPAIWANEREVKHVNNIEVLGRDAWEQVHMISRHPYCGEIIKITSRCGGIELTPNHSLIDMNGDSVRPQEFGARRNLPHPPWASVPNDNKARILRYGHRAQCSLFVGPTELAWLCGLFVAEGSLANKRTGRCFGIGIANTDPVIRLRTKRALETLLHVRANDNGKSTVTVNDARADAYFARCYTVGIRGSGTKSIPFDIVNADPAVKWAFLEGYLDGDGTHARKRPWFEVNSKKFERGYATKSPVLAQQLAWMINELTGLRPRWYWRKDKNVYCVYFSSIKQDTLTNVPATSHFKGHVYDLTTASGMYRAGVGGILVKNTALKDRQENDFSVGYIGGLDQNGCVWVTDRIKDHMPIGDIVRGTISSHEKWQLVGAWFEDSAAGTPATQLIMEEMPVVPCRTVYYGGGKRNRAEVLAQYIRNGQIRFPRNAEWVKDAVYNLTHFPHVAHDDDVDALFVLADNLLKVMHPAQIENRRRMVLEMR